MFFIMPPVLQYEGIVLNVYAKGNINFLGLAAHDDRSEQREDQRRKDKIRHKRPERVLRLDAIVGREL